MTETEARASLCRRSLDGAEHLGIRICNIKEVS